MSTTTNAGIYGGLILVKAVSPRGWRLRRKRSPMALSMASGQPRPLDELTVGIAPLGISMAAS